MNVFFWLQLLVNGLILGFGYACIAIGWTILLGTARLVNFGHGAMYMVGAFLVWYLMSRFRFSYVGAIVLSVVCLALLGVVIQRMLRQLIEQQNLTSIMIVTLGMGYVLQGGAALAFSGAPQNLLTPLRPVRYELGEIRFTLQDLTMVLVTLCLYAIVWIVSNRTRVGAAVRALAEDSKLAQLFGLNTAVLYAGIFAFECGSVALAAALVAPRAPMLTSMGFEEVIMTFVVVVLGGIGSVTGALIAGLSLGIFIVSFGALVSSAYALAATFAMLLVTLLFRPNGFTRG